MAVMVSMAMKFTYQRSCGSTCKSKGSSWTDKSSNCKRSCQHCMPPHGSYAAEASSDQGCRATEGREMEVQVMVIPSRPLGGNGCRKQTKMISSPQSLGG